MPTTDHCRRPRIARPTYPAAAAPRCAVITGSLAGADELREFAQLPGRRFGGAGLAVLGVLSFEPPLD